MDHPDDNHGCDSQRTFDAGCIIGILFLAAVLFAVIDRIWI